MRRGGFNQRGNFSQRPESQPSLRAPFVSNNEFPPDPRVQAARRRSFVSFAEEDWTPFPLAGGSFFSLRELPQPPQTSRYSHNPYAGSAPPKAEPLPQFPPSFFQPRIEFAKATCPHCNKAEQMTEDGNPSSLLVLHFGHKASGRPLNNSGAQAECMPTLGTVTTKVDTCVGELSFCIVRLDSAASPSQVKLSQEHCLGKLLPEIGDAVLLDPDSITLFSPAVRADDPLGLDGYTTKEVSFPADETTSVIEAPTATVEAVAHAALDDEDQDQVASAPSRPVTAVVPKRIPVPAFPVLLGDFHKTLGTLISAVQTMLTASYNPDAIIHAATGQGDDAAAGEDFICSICYDVPRDVKFLSQCGHLFCRQCLDRQHQQASFGRGTTVMVQSQCPSCRKDTKFFPRHQSISIETLETTNIAVPDVRSKQKINQLRIWCPFAQILSGGEDVESAFTPEQKDALKTLQQFLQKRTDFIDSLQDHPHHSRYANLEVEHFFGGTKWKQRRVFQCDCEWTGRIDTFDEHLRMHIAALRDTLTTVQEEVQAVERMSAQETHDWHRELAVHRNQGNLKPIFPCSCEQTIDRRRAKSIPTPVEPADKSCPPPEAKQESSSLGPTQSSGRKRKGRYKSSWNRLKNEKQEKPNDE